MTLTNTTLEQSFAGDDSSVSFSFTFSAQNTSQVKVYTQSGSADPVAITTGFSITLNVEPTPGGTITFSTAPATGTTIIARRETDFLQNTAILLDGNLDERALEKAIDKLTMQDQDIKQRLSRSLQFPFGSSSSLSAVIPPVSSRAGKALGFDDSGNLAMFAVDSVTSTSVLATGSTTARTLENRFAEVYNVLDWGALGDGSNDDTSSIQAAIDAASAADGGTVFLPAGTYRVKGLTLKSNVWVRGSSRKGTKIRLADGSNTDVLDGTDPSAFGIRLSDFHVHGNKAGNSSGSGVNFDRSSGYGSSYDARIFVENCEFIYCADYGMHTQHNSRLIFATGCYFEYNGKDGISCYGSDNVFMGCVSDNNGFSGFRINASFNSLVACRAFLNGEADPANGDGFMVVGGSSEHLFGVTLNGCIAQDNWGYGGYFGYCDGLTVVGCVSDHNSALGPSDGTVNGSKLYDGFRFSNCNGITATLTVTERFYISNGTRSHAYGVYLNTCTNACISVGAYNVENPYHLYPGTTEDLTNPTNNTIIVNGKYVNSTNVDALTYASGSWTPVVGSAGGSTAHTYTTQVGRWTLNGRELTAHFRCVINTLDGSAPAGAVRITGLPVASSNISGMFFIGSCFYRGVNLAAGYNDLKAFVEANASYITLNQVGDSQTGFTNLAQGDIAGGTEISGTVTYIMAGK